LLAEELGLEGLLGLDAPLPEGCADLLVLLLVEPFVPACELD
jgi:hypothetical protein